MSACPDDPWTYADTTNNTCVFNCSGGLYAYAPNRTCLATCPPGFFMENTSYLCLNLCLYNQFSDPATNSCLTNCTSSGFTYIYYDNQTCVNECPSTPDLYGYQNNDCRPQCPTGWFAENFTRTCVQVCPNISLLYLNESWADPLLGRCVSRCSALSYSYTNTTDNVCVTVCPTGYFASTLTQACVLSCPNGTFAHISTMFCV